MSVELKVNVPLLEEHTDVIMYKVFVFLRDTAI